MLAKRLCPSIFNWSTFVQIEALSFFLFPFQCLCKLFKTLEWRCTLSDFQDFYNVVGSIFCFPGSTSPVERIFSLMNSMWTKEKLKLSIEIMKAMLIVKQNVTMECDKFYHKVLKNMNVRQKITSSEKDN